MAKTSCACSTKSSSSAPSRPGFCPQLRRRVVRPVRCRSPLGNWRKVATYSEGDGWGTSRLDRITKNRSVHTFSLSWLAKNMEGLIRGISSGDGNLMAVIFPGKFLYSKDTCLKKSIELKQWLIEKVQSHLVWFVHSPQKTKFGFAVSQLINLFGDLVLFNLLL